MAKSSPPTSGEVGGYENQLNGFACDSNSTRTQEGKEPVASEATVK